MTKAEKEKIMYAAFYDELEKNAGAMELAWKGVKFLGQVGKTLGTKGKTLEFATKGLKEAPTLSKAVEYVKPYMSNHNFTKGLDGTINSVAGTEKSTFIQSHVADAVHYVDSLRKGVMEQTTGTGVLKNFGKNLWGSEKQQYLEVAHKPVFTKNLQPGQILRNSAGKATHVKPGAFTRKIRGQITNAKGELIGYNVKKLAPFRMLGYGMVPSAMVGIGAAASMAGGESPGKGAKEGIEEAALWTPLTKGIGATKFMAYDLPKMLLSRNSENSQNSN